MSHAAPKLYRVNIVQLRGCIVSTLCGSEVVLCQHGAAPSCIVSTSASKRKWQVGAQYFQVKKTEMLFDQNDSQPSQFIKGIDQSPRVVFEDAPCDENRLNFRLNAWRIKPVC